MHFRDPDTEDEQKVDNFEVLSDEIIIIASGEQHGKRQKSLRFDL